MKRIHLSLTICILVTLFSCTKDAIKWERTKVNEVKMISYGFYKADNPSVLVKDYVVNQINASSILVLLPENIDKSALIARFTVSENDVALVGTTVQKPGETINDFNIPIDYILSDGNNNAKYTVSIGKGDGYIWTSIPFTIADSALSINLKINPVTDNPYIMYNQSRPSSADQKAAMVSYQNNQWVDNGAISDGRAASNIDFTFNSTGVPYASYVDYTATVAQAHTVKKHNGGTSWSLVGNKGITTARGTFNALSFVTDSKLLLFSYLDAANVLARRELGVSTFENNTWTTNGTIPGRASTLYGYLPVAKNINGVIYLGVFNASTPNSVSIYKLENNTWTTLVDQWRDATPSAINVRDFDMDVDGNGNVYAAFADNSSNALYKYRVIKYTAATKTVKPFGSYIAGASGNLFSFDLAVSPTDVPYLFYRNSSNYPTIVSFDNDSQDWSSPYTFESEVGDELTMSFAANGEAFAAYIKSRKIIVYKYSAP